MSVKNRSIFPTGDIVVWDSQECQEPVCTCASGEVNLLLLAFTRAYSPSMSLIRFSQTCWLRLVTVLRAVTRRIEAWTAWWGIRWAPGKSKFYRCCMLRIKFLLLVQIGQPVMVYLGCWVVLYPLCLPSMCLVATAKIDLWLSCMTPDRTILRNSVTGQNGRFGTADSMSRDQVGICGQSPKAETSLKDCWWSFLCKPFFVFFCMFETFWQNLSAVICVRHTGS